MVQIRARMRSIIGATGPQDENHYKTKQKLNFDEKL